MGITPNKQWYLKNITISQGSSLESGYNSAYPMVWRELFLF